MDMSWELPEKPSEGRPKRGRRSPADSGNDRCCPMVAAFGAARRRKWRLARRYAAMSLRRIVMLEVVWG